MFEILSIFVTAPHYVSHSDANLHMGPSLPHLEIVQASIAVGYISRKFEKIPIAQMLKLPSGASEWVWIYILTMV